jgi:hypothetical protein
LLHLSLLLAHLPLGWMDPLGKGLAQILLGMRARVPRSALGGRA